MSIPVIRVESLSKRYNISHQNGARDGLRHALENTFRHPVRWLKERNQTQREAREDFWALRDVSFEVKQGEVMGVIGRNGAGKSTLLKILSRITEPTSGRIELEGRVASLLEVGTGFHPELTGRENIFLNGAILGMTRVEIKRKFDEIVAFSEIEKFLDTPVKRYSSGMYVRLAFAVAAHLEPEILILDEVLAVGDVQFQKKCLGKMSEVAKGGRTVIFVSHNMGVVANLCKKAVWLKSGSVHQIGPAKTTVQEYLLNTSSPSAAQVNVAAAARQSDNGSRLLITNLEWLDGLPLQHGVKARLKITAVAKTAVEGISMGFGFATVENTRLLTFDSDFQNPHRADRKAGESVSVVFEIPSLPLGPGVYNLDVGARSGDFHCLDYLQGVVQIDVSPGPDTPGHIIRDASGPRMSAEITWISV